MKKQFTLVLSALLLVGALGVFCVGTSIGTYNGSKPPKPSIN